MVVFFCKKLKKILLFDNLIIHDIFLLMYYGKIGCILNDIIILIMEKIKKEKL